MNDTVFSTYREASSSSSDVNQMRFLMRRALAKMRTCTLGQVVAVTNAGGIAPVGTVDVQLLVDQVDAIGNSVPLPVIYNVPYSRLQGGSNAVVLDPQVGDIGAIVFGDRDLSTVISTKAQGIPGSNRRNSLSDALWLGCLLGAAPTQYVQFTSTGITVLSPNKVTIQAPDIELVGPVHITGAVTTDSTIVASGNVTGQGTSLHTHKHGLVQSGTSDTGVPV